MTKWRAILWRIPVLGAWLQWRKEQREDAYWRRLLQVQPGGKG